MKNTRNSNPLFPVFLKVDQLPVLIVGGGDAGSEKLRFLMKSSPDAQVTLVAERVSEEIQQIAAAYPHLVVRERPFKNEDLAGKRIAIIATDNRELNSSIRDQAIAAGLLANVADTPDLCEFYLGAIVTRGDLKVAISTNGKSPTFAKRFRQVLEEVLPDSTEALLLNLRSIRDSLKLNFGQKVTALNELTASLVEKEGAK